MWVPPIVGSVGRPPLIGYVATTCPFCVTVILNVARLAIDTRASPIVKRVAPEPAPQASPPACQPLSDHTTVTVRPCGHKAFGR